MTIAMGKLEDSQRRSGATPWIAAVLAMPLILAGCSWVSDEEAAQPSGLSSEAQPAENESYPNLGSVPDQRPTVTSEEQREALQQGLREQRNDILPETRSSASGSYSDGSGNPPPAPQPSTQSAPSSSQSSGLTPTQRLNQQAAQPSLPQYNAPQQVSQQVAQQPGYSGGGEVLAGETPPGMVEPMAFNQGGYGLGTTVISSGGVSQPSAGAGAAFLPGSQTASTDYGAAYSGVSNLAGVIYFGHGSTGLDGNDRQILKDIAEAQRARGGTLIVVGHASARTQTLNPDAHFEANQEVSQRRAQAVAEALRGLGVSSNSLFVEARGAGQPVYQESMPTGEAGNRRVEIYLR